jgi:hypothetical protein
MPLLSVGHAHLSGVRAWAKMHRSPEAVPGVAPFAPPLPQSRDAVRTSTVHRSDLRKWLPRLAALAVLSTVGPLGCTKLRQEREASTQAHTAAEAIQRYSQASDAANLAHKAVMDAFDKANRSANLPDYKAALRTLVLPAMDAFLVKLRAMPTGTPELVKIHGLLVDAYTQARREIDDYEKGLQSADGLRQFTDIRTHLQQRVKAYREALAKYYGQYQRQLRLDAPDASALPGQSSPTGLPAAATP